MKKTLLLFFISAFLNTLSVGAFAHTEDAPFVTDLIAGGGNFESAILVGQVNVWNDDNYIYVKYLITNPDWCMTSTHLHIATSLEGIPQKKGNPPPGKFDYKMPHECSTEYTYAIEMTWPVGTELYIAAHADVCTMGGLSSHVDAFAEMLPDTATMSLITGMPVSEFLITITNGGILDGVYNGWCVDRDNGIYLDGSILYDVYAVSSYEELPCDAIEYPENLDLVNWILNQDFVGKESPGGYGVYTASDVQLAIWTLIEDDLPSTYPQQQARADEIVSAAQANGEGYIPGCFDLMAVILFPFSEDICPNAQPVLIPIVLPCVPAQCETAWANGFDFPGKNWALYFTYEIQQEQVNEESFIFLEKKLIRKR
jgi:hypothetical protein